MYESPIMLLRAQTDIFIKEINEKTDEVIFKAVVNVLPQVNKDELIKALAYDRGQYVKGYQDRDAEIVRCKDCRYYDDFCEVCRCQNWDLSSVMYPHVEPGNFCSFAERREL